MKSITKFSLLLLTAFLVSCSGISQKPNTVAEDISAAEFKTKIGELDNEQILDVRTPDEWASGTIDGASKMNFFDEDFAEQVAALDTTKPVLVYCKSGGRSSKAMAILNKAGFKEVYNLKGGFTAWKSEGN